VSVGKSEVKSQLGNLDGDGRIILKLILKVLDLDWVKVSHYRGERRDAVNMTKKLRVTLNTRNFFGS
jgi:hypothetical protein